MANTVSDNNSITVGFPLYRFDYEFYHKLKSEGRIKHGELTKFMRLQFRQFLESHAGNMPKAATKVKNGSKGAQVSKDEGFAGTTANSEGGLESSSQIAKSSAQIGGVQPPSVYVKQYQISPKSLQEEGYPAGHNI